MLNTDLVYVRDRELCELHADVVLEKVHGAADNLADIVDPQPLVVLDRSHLDQEH